MRKTYWFLVIAISLCVFGTQKMYAQSLARIDGIVADQSQAVVVGAKVTIRNADTGVVTTEVADSTGQYVFPSVLPGTYKLTVQMDGFKAWTRSVVAHANDHITVNVPLSIGDVSTTVTVTSTTEQMDSGQRSQTLTSDQIQALATLSRNAEELVPLTAGVVTNAGGGYGSSQFGSGATSSATTGVDAFNINGNRSDANTFKLDGGNMDDLTGNNGSNIYPNSEFISEITVETSNFTADQGGSPVLITAITKSGTKDLHGEAYYIGRNSIFDGNDWSNNFAGTPRRGLFNYGGFDLTGPIIIPGLKYNRGPNKKLFFFFGTEFSRQNPDPGTELTNVPTNAELGGDFSQIVFSNICTNARGSSAGAGNTYYLQHPCQITDPLTGLTLDKQGGIITGANPTLNGRGLLKSLMGPGLVGPNYNDPGGLWNYAASPAAPININQYVGRFDWDPSDKARFYVRLGRQDETDVKPWGEYVGAGSTWTSNVPEPSPTLSEYNSRSLNVNMVNVLSPTLTNEFSFNTNVLRQPNAYQDASLLSRQSLGVNFSGLYNNGSPQFAQIVPAFVVCDSLNTSGCGSGGGAPPATGRWGESNLVGAGNFYKQTQFEFADNLSKVTGAHNLKFGGNIGRARNDQNEAADPLEGYLVPSTWAGTTTGDEYADVLTEHFSEYEQANHDVLGRLRSSSFEWYGQDSWKIRKNLTLEFGVRWTLQGPWYDASGLGATFDPSAYTKSATANVYDGVRTASCANPGQSAVALCGTIPKTVRPYPIPLTQPRVGFSWDTTGRGQTILRGGFGMYTQRDPTNAGFGALLGPPNIQEATICCGLSLAQYASSSPGSQGSFTYGDSAAVYDPKDGANPIIYQYNLTVSQSLSYRMSADIAYVGSQSRNLQLEQNIDNVPLGALWVPGTHNVLAASIGNEGNYAPYFPFKQIVQIQHTGRANYNGLQATLKRSSSRTFDFSASYTYSKAMGDSDQFQAPLADPFSNDDSYHVLSFDRTHLFAMGAQWYVPKGARGFLEHNIVARGVLNGWMFSGIAKAQSGAPIAISSYISCVQGGLPCPTSGTGLIWSQTDSWFGTNAYSTAYLPGSTTSSPSGVYASYTCDPRRGHGGINSQFLNTNCITLPSFGQQGAINPPYMKGPATSDYDIALQKSFPMGGGGARHLDIRISSFDFLNRGALNPINAAAQFTLTVPVGATDPSTGTVALTNGNQPCNDGVGGLGYSCGKVGSRKMEGSAKIFF